MSYNISSHDDYLSWRTITAKAIESEYVLSSTVLFIAAIVAYWWLAAPEKSTKTIITNDGYEVPLAPGGIPLLGHALLYRKDPPGFLVRTRTQCGPVFKLNLAGKKMILVCGAEEQRQLASLPESVMSLRKAVGAIGFEQTLGYKNVHTGTQIHKGIVKAIWNSSNSRDGTSPADAMLQTWQTTIRDAMQKEFGVHDDGSHKFDFFHLVRRVMLRATIEVFVGKAFLRDWTSYNFLTEFMAFQDELEDVTAKVVVVPRPLALVAMLWPLQRRRERMQLVMQERLEKVLKSKENGGSDGDRGFWLREVLAQNIPISDIAEYIVGLLFAGHKNPSIGAAQSYLLLRQHGSEEVQARCQKESELLVSSTKPIKWSQFKSLLPTLDRACLESLRVTSHSIGGVRTAQRELTISVKTEKDAEEIIYRIPKESSVGFAHITSSLDTSIWGEEASVFDSDLCRYSDELYSDDYKFTTFSHGVHKCPGRELAMIHLKITVALLLTEYDVKLPDKISPLDFERATLAQREGPVMVTITQQQREQK